MITHPWIRRICPRAPVRHREDLLRRTDKLMVDQTEAYVAPLRAEGVAVSPILRVGNPREVIGRWRAV